MNRRRKPRQPCPTLQALLALALVPLVGCLFAPLDDVKDSASETALHRGGNSDAGSTARSSTVGQPEVPYPNESDVPRDAGEPPVDAQGVALQPLDAGPTSVGFEDSAVPDPNLQLGCALHACAEGATRCQDGVQESCGEHDGDSCYEWGARQDCPNGCAGDLCAACSPEGSPCMRDENCCPAGSKAGTCVAGTCRTPCTNDNQCSTCCLADFDANNVFQRRTCALTTTACDESNQSVAVGWPCSRDEQCRGVASCDVGGFCTRACSSTFGSGGCGAGPLFHNVCSGAAFSQCYPTCDSDKDCTAFPGTRCQTAYSVDRILLMLCVSEESQSWL